jgi:hypothetical protein
MRRVRRIVATWQQLLQLLRQHELPLSDNAIEFFGNLSDELHEQLAAGG